MGGTILSEITIIAFLQKCLKCRGYLRGLSLVFFECASRALKNNSSVAEKRYLFKLTMARRPIQTSPHLTAISNRQ